MNKNILICVNPKGYKLTKDKEYEVDHKGNGFVFIKNDNEKISKYSNNLFKAKEEPKLTLDQLINNIIVINDLNQDNKYCTLKYKNPPYEKNTTLEFTESSVSCGILEINNLNGLSIFCKNVIDHENTDITVRELLASIIEDNIVTNPENITYMFSTNTNFEHFNDVELVLDNMTDASLQKYNNNSGNTIKTWLL